jgi:cathepsin B
MRALILLVLTGVASAAPTLEEIVDIVNSNPASTWVAALPKNFASVEDVRPHLGAYLKGHPQHKAPAVKVVEESDDIPASFDARKQWPKCGGIAKIRDQSACGSCWAFASVDSYQDRACVATGMDIRYSPEDTAFCSDAGNGCEGGSSAWDWFKATGVATGGDYFDIGKGDTCLPYSLAPCAHHVPATDKYKKCPQGDYPSPQCSYGCSEKKFNGSYNTKGRATDSYSLNGVKQIQTDLMKKGPLYVAFTVYADFQTYKSGVYKHTTGESLGGHAVELIGWGTESGTDYWLIKNSWNEEWGDGGTFKMVRGTDECGIEDDVNGGTVSSTPPAPAPPPAPVEPGQCDGKESHDSCLATSQGGKTCVWCIYRGIRQGVCQTADAPDCNGSPSMVV